MAHSVFEMILSGKNIRIEADYTCTMQSRYLDADGWQIPVDPEPRAKAAMTVYVDGVKYDTCDDANFWRLIEVPGHEGRKIWGVKLGFKSAEVCDQYEAFIEALIAEGTSDEVREYRAAIEAKRYADDVEYAKRVIAACERQHDLPTKDEAKRRMKAYNDAVNEGGEGYVPHIYSIEDYERAKSIIAK